MTFCAKIEKRYKLGLITMGWSGGSELMEDLIDSYNKNLILSDIPDQNVIDFWKSVIKDFENQDADTLDDCLGNSALWDKAYFEVNPYADGFHNGKEGQNPYKKGTQKYTAWNNGKLDAKD